MKKVVLTETQLRKLVYETALKTLGLMKEDRWYPYPKQDKFYNTWLADYSNKRPQWFDKSLQEPAYNEEGAKAGMEEDAVDAYQAMSSIFDKAVALDKWAQKKQVPPKYADKALDRYKPYTWRGDLNLTRMYLDARSRETGEAKYQIVISDMNAPQETAMENIKKYLSPELDKVYHNKFDTYKKDYDSAMAYRGKFDAAMSPLIEKYANADPSSMSYVQICKAMGELENALDENPEVKYEYGKRYSGIASDGADKYYEGQPILAAYNNLKAEKKNRENSVKFYNIGYLNQFTQDGLAHGWTTNEKWNEWRELQGLMEKYHKFGTKSGNPMNWRCYSHTIGALVDDNGELVCTYSYEVDSSD